VAEFGDDRFELWFGTSVVLVWTADTLRIAVDSHFRVERLRKRLLAEIQGIVRSEAGSQAQVALVVDPTLVQDPPPTEVLPIAERPKSSSPRRAESAAVAAIVSMPTVGMPARTERSWTERMARGRQFARLESLVAGDCNRMALRAAELVIGSPGQVNPLFVHGPSGAGKTHLLEGIWCDVRRRGGRRIIYLTAEQFTTYFLQALRGSGLPSFRQKYRAVDLLVLDDVQFFVGKQATLNELLHTLDALLRDGRQVVLSADRPPSDLVALGSELQARVSGGLVCAMEPLNHATRRELLQRLAEDRQVPLDDATLDRIAERATGDARQLQGMLNRLWATCQLDSSPLSEATIEGILDELYPPASNLIRLDDIQRVVCDEFGIDPAVLRSEKKARSVSHPRMLAMFLARKFTPAALTEIGEFFGRRSHSTVLSAQHKVEDWLTSGQRLRSDRGHCDVRTLLSRLERNLRA
jgi:chromosomal replication initiator protein